MDVDALLADLDASQRAAVTESHLPLAILAGAGSGKTRVLTRRIAWQAAAGNLEPEHVLAVTFTRKAAGELRDRLARLGVRPAVTAGTFHAVALAQLRRRYADTGRAMPTVLARKGRILAPLVPGKGAERTVALNEVAAEIEWAKARLVSPARYEEAVATHGRATPRPPAQIASIYERYEREKARRGLVDFDDVLWQCTRELEDDDGFAAAQRWRFGHIFVDEFQDATRLQMRLLRAWLGPEPSLCAVGDPDQAIYGFAGADPAFLTRFEDLFPGATTVRLGCNYRSTPQIVAAARAALPEGGQPVEAPAADGPLPVITEFPDDAAEARAVAHALQSAHGPDRPWSSMAVLYRINAQSARFEEVLSRLHIPHRVRGDRGFLERPEVRAALEELRVVERRAPGRRFEEHLTDLVATTRELPEDRREHMEALARLAAEYVETEGGAGSVQGFEGYLVAALRGDDVVSAGDAVELLTFHRAKGLEWDTVFVTGLEHGLVPISHATGKPDELAEEQRLLYVALSRARRWLHLSWSAQRALGTRAVNRKPSRWLGAIQSVIDGASPEDAVRAAADGVARARAALAASGGSNRTRREPDVDAADRPLYEALVEWRSGVARLNSVPAYVVFDNKTLAAVARRRPGSHTQLLDVPGIGPTKAERYGATLLELVARHAAAPAG